jgi:hypothetical protein
MIKDKIFNSQHFPFTIQPNPSQKRTHTLSHTLTHDTHHSLLTTVAEL